MSRFFSKVMNLLFFWKTAGSKTRIPMWVKGYQYSLSISEQNAANKVISYAKKHHISSKEMRSIFDFELEYEKLKLTAQHDFPHMPKIMKEDIAKAKSAKYLQIREQLGEELYNKYKTHRGNEKQRRY